MRFCPLIPCCRLASWTLMGIAAQVSGATLTWSGGGDGQTFSHTANWLGTPTGGMIDVASLVDTYVVNSAANIANVFANLEFRAGGRLEMSAGDLDVLANGDFGLGRVESPPSFGSILLTGGRLSARYLAEMNVAIGGDATLSLSGPTNPVNTSTVDLLGSGATVHFLNETPAAFVSEHLTKFTVQGAAAVLGLNLQVVGDGNAGSLVTLLIPTAATVQLLVDRDTGNLSLSNTTGQAVEFFQYDIFSSAGGVSEALWNPISGRLDSPVNGGNGTVDPDDVWLRFTPSSSRTDLAEGTLGAAVLASGQSIELGAAWIASPFEDLVATMSLTNGADVPIEVIYSGSQLVDAITPGDLNADGRVDADDWPSLRDQLFTSVEGRLLVDAHAAGDIDGSGKVDEIDFLLFMAAFDGENGSGSFAAMSRATPEPRSGRLCLLAVAVWCVHRCGLRRSGGSLTDDRVLGDSRVPFERCRALRLTGPQAFHSGLDRVNGHALGFRHTKTIAGSPTPQASRMPLLSDQGLLLCRCVLVMALGGVGDLSAAPDLPITLEPVLSVQLEGAVRQLRAVPVALGPDRPLGFLTIHSADAEIDPYIGMFFFPRSTLKMTLFTEEGEQLWQRDLGPGVVPGIWFCPVFSFDTDRDGVDEVWFVGNQTPEHPLDYREHRLVRLDARTGERTGDWPWPYRAEPPQTMSHTYRNFIFGGFVRDEPVLVTAQGTYGRMALQGWNADMTRRWGTSLDPVRDGMARGSHVSPVVDLDHDGVDEVLWGERVIELDRGAPRFCADQGRWDGHSDIVMPVLMRERNEWLIFTCREEQVEMPPRIVMFNATGDRRWAALEHGHIDTGWAAHLGPHGGAAVLGVRVGNKVRDAQGERRLETESFVFDADHGQPLHLGFDPYTTIPVDLNGDGGHELVKGYFEGDGEVLDHRGRSLGNVGGLVAMCSKFMNRPGEQILSYRRDGKVTLWADANAIDSEAALKRYALRCYYTNQRMTACGYNLFNLGGL
ncbi:hypothetical protein Pla175_19260 [Pirellulimonas nuda]|uniref:Rhamnogalacturonan lyase family 11 C-terminal domain-containing protein n=1 Tax=Pirellulimonas nuda TaxID=2528009 RepID=A0A518DAQ8_9BACT|nr:hypothetical protein [Pirellulimonas nuda]QDU88548.1 hypothetical protein Pla175_19260 [Pirellulimonas nuda]